MRVAFYYLALALMLCGLAAASAQVSSPSPAVAFAVAEIEPLDALDAAGTHDYVATLESESTDTGLGRRQEVAADSAGSLAPASGDCGLMVNIESERHPAAAGKVEVGRGCAPRSPG